MFDFLKNIFNRKDKNKDIKKFSSTTTDATEGSNSKRELNPEINHLLTKLDLGDNINNDDLNKLLKYYFNKDEIKPGIYKLNPDMVEGMCFNINTVNTIIDKETKDVENIVLVMNEIVYNSEINLHISVKDFHEFLKYIEPFKPKETA